MFSIDREREPVGMAVVSKLREEVVLSLFELNLGSRRHIATATFSTPLQYLLAIDPPRVSSRAAPVLHTTLIVTTVGLG